MERRRAGGTHTSERNALLGGGSRRSPRDIETEMGLGDEDFFGNQLQHQEAELATQDAHLDELHDSVKRLGQLTLNITGEIDEQLEIMNELDTEVDNAAAGMSLATKRTEQFIKENGGNMWCCLVLVLFGLLCFLTVLVLFT